jgi:hypothetical protein
VIEVLEKKRPGIFSRWVLGDAQPFDGKGVIEFAPSDLQEIQAQVKRVYIAKVEPMPACNRTKPPPPSTADARPGPGPGCT